MKNNKTDYCTVRFNVLYLFKQNSEAHLKQQEKNMKTLKLTLKIAGAAALLIWIGSVIQTVVNLINQL